MLAKFIVRAIFAALGLWIASKIVPGVGIDNAGTLIIAALLLGVVNAFVRPVVFVLTLPLTVITLGLFLLVATAPMTRVAAMSLRGSVVSRRVPAFLAAALTGLPGSIGHMAFKAEREDAPRRPAVRVRHALDGERHARPARDRGVGLD